MQKKIILDLEYYLKKITERAQSLSFFFFFFKSSIKLSIYDRGSKPPL